MTTQPGAHRVLIVAGEASGDLHGANLIKAAREQAPGLSFFGIGGERMTAAGCEVLIPSEDLAVMGLVEVVGSLPTIWSALSRLKAVLNGPERPDLVILIDYAGFNLRVAKAAKAAGVPVLYYICPKIWAWGRKRGRLLAERVDRVAVIFPFEEKLFADLGVPVDYVGNPLMDEIQSGLAATEYRETLGLKSAEPVVGLFPGSRVGEIQRIFPTLLETAQRLAAQGRVGQFLLPVAAGLDEALLSEPVRRSGLEIKMVKGNIYEIAGACDAVLCVSGTATLQVALAGTPMAVVYKVSPLTFALASRLVKLEHVSLVNIVAGREVVPEFLQDNAQPDKLEQAVLNLLDNPVENKSMRLGLAEVKMNLGEKGCSGRVARIALEMLNPEMNKGS